ncbi:MAG: hypothetical protein WA398_07780 [Nitrososphaeraceae archaeon]
MKHRFGPKQTRLNVDLDSKHSAMVEFLKKEYGMTYGAELMRFLIKQAYDKAKGPYSLEES